MTGQEAIEVKLAEAIDLDENQIHSITEQAQEPICVTKQLNANAQAFTPGGLPTAAPVDHRGSLRQEAPAFVPSFSPFAKPADPNEILKEEIVQIVHGTAMEGVVLKLLPAVYARVLGRSLDLSFTSFADLSVLAGSLNSKQVTLLPEGTRLPRTIEEAMSAAGGVGDS